MFMQPTLKNDRSMRLACGIALGGMAVFAAVCFAFGSRSPEPVFSGKPITVWLEAGSEPAAMAVHELGPAATPWIFKKLRCEHPRWGYWQRYRNYWSRLPTFARRMLPKPKATAYDEFSAGNALLEIGPQVIPQLTDALAENNPAIRISSAMALGALRQPGIRGERSLAALKDALSDTRVEVREQVARAIERGERRPQQ